MSKKPVCGLKKVSEAPRMCAPAHRAGALGALAAATLLLGWPGATDAQIRLVTPDTVIPGIEVQDTNEQVFAQGFRLAFDRDSVNAALSESVVAGLELSVAGRQVRTVVPVAEGELLVASNRADAQIRVTHVETTAAGHNIVFQAQNAEGPIDLKQTEVAVFNADRTPVCSTLKAIDEVDSPMLFDLLIDHSGSMGPYMPVVKTAVTRFFAALPRNARCRVTSFNATYRRHTPTYRACDAREHGLEQLQAQGNTDIFAALAAVYDDHHVAGQHQRAVVVITDGVGQSAITRAQLQHKKNAVTFVYWLGNYDERRLQGLADAYIHGRKEASATLRRYFQSIGEAVRAQQVLVTNRTCKDRAHRTR